MQSAIPLPTSAAPAAPAALAVAALRPGQVLHARVLSVAQDGAVVLDLGGRSVAARAEVALAPGQQLALKVQAAGRETVLQLVDARGAPLPGRLQLAAGGGAMPQGPALLPSTPLRAPAGTQLQARVLDAAHDGRLLLEVGGERVAARAQGYPQGTQPQPGQVLALRVDGHTGALLPQPAAGAGAAGTTGQPSAGAGAVGPLSPQAAGLASALALLRASLPQQQPVASALAVLARAAAEPALPGGGALHTALGSLLRALPRAADVADPARLAAMVRDSGLFHEARAARRADGGPDLKARLASVARALAAAADGPGLEALADATRGALARIETLQVASAQGGPDGPVWHLELPLAHAGGVDELRMRLARERRGNGGEDAGDGSQAGPVWSAELLLAPADGAALHARVSLTASGVVAVLTTEDSALHAALDAGRGALEALLAAARLELASLTCRHAALPDLSPPPPPGPLVSEIA